MRSLLALAAQAALASGSGFPSARPAGPTFEQDEIDLSNARQWVAVESDRCISFNSVDPFEDAAARVPGRFALAPQQGQQQQQQQVEQLEVDPAAISVRALLLFAPLQWDDLRTAYRCASPALSPLPLIFSNKSEKSLCGTGPSDPWTNRSPTAPAGGSQRPA